MMTNRCTNSVGFLLNRFKHSCECRLRICFSSIFRKCGNHLAHSFYIPNSSCKMFGTLCSVMTTTSAISYTFIRLSSNTMLCTFLQFLAILHVIEIIEQYVKTLKFTCALFNGWNWRSTKLSHFWMIPVFFNFEEGCDYRIQWLSFQYRLFSHS